jgi:hypothetical protein
VQRLDELKSAGTLFAIWASVAALVFLLTAASLHWGYGGAAVFALVCLLFLVPWLLYVLFLLFGPLFDFLPVRSTPAAK